MSITAGHRLSRRQMVGRHAVRPERQPSPARRAFAEAPPRVEYSLTELGQTLQEPIVMLTQWARNNGESIVDFRESAAPESPA